MDEHGISDKVNQECLPKETKGMLRILPIHFITGPISMLKDIKQSASFINVGGLGSSFTVRISA